MGRMERKEGAERLTAALIEFVERASKKEATPAEVEALPRVARVLSDLIQNYIQ